MVGNKNERKTVQSQAPKSYPSIPDMSLFLEQSENVMLIVTTSQGNFSELQIYA